MALPWSTQAIADITNIGTTEQHSAEIQLDANEALSGNVKIGPHPNDDITVVAYEGQDGTLWAERDSFVILAGDEEAKPLGPILAAKRVRWGLYASGSTDLPTASFDIDKGAVNAG